MIACGTKILAPVLSVTGINRVQWTGAACTSARRLPTSKATMRGLKPSPDWTWSHWLCRRATSVVQWGPLERRFANATSVHGAFFFLHNRSSFVSNTHCQIHNNTYRCNFFFHVLPQYIVPQQMRLTESQLRVCWFSSASSRGPSWFHGLWKVGLKVGSRVSVCAFGCLVVWLWDTAAKQSLEIRDKSQNRYFIKKTTHGKTTHFRHTNSNTALCVHYSVNDDFDS